MMLTRLYTPLCFTMLMLVGCIQPSTSPSMLSDDETAIIKSAVTYLQNKNWLPTDENGKRATIQSITVDDRYDLVDDRFEGTRAWIVTFPPDSQRTVEIPQVLVESESNDVIGHLLSE
ncbi:conserved exported hypothetical protein [Exiguobacterium sp. 8A]|uniref:hypothetical protein n=1 Tax=unclassified Exiguobacterium TaxID=2644629 RepID=UPI0012F29D15|nr:MULTISPECIES: hypothetical protein [unclassified Exiguobacterium]VXB29588.1 conserved exported hypothetical protein [Exiguobacterium sp. 8A]